MQISSIPMTYLIGLAAFVASNQLNAQIQRGNFPASSSTTTQRSNELQLDGAFTIECIKKIDVAAQADGLLEEMNVDEGSNATKGALLFRIDNRVAKAQLEVATKKYESAVEQAKQDAELRFSEASYKVANSEYEKEKELLSKGATTEAVVRRKGLDAEKAELSIEVAKVKRVTEGLAAKVAEAEMNAAAVQLGLYDIISPFDAFVNERLKTEGAWIKAGEPVLKIVQMSEMRVTGYVKLGELYARGWGIGHLEGAKISATVNVTPAQQVTVESVISFVSSDVDTSNSVRVSARIKNERIGNSWVLRDGIPAIVRIVVE